MPQSPHGALMQTMHLFTQQCQDAIVTWDSNVLVMA